MTVTFASLGQYGRLGNQLWQCAATIGYSFYYNCDYVFPKWEHSNDFNIPTHKFLNHIKYDSTFEEPHFHYAKIPYTKNVNLHGYFQSYKYWKDYEKNIRELLTPKKTNTQLGDFTAIHVRRTDYLIHTGCYNILDMKYYEKAMDIINSPKYLIFSDDIKWCKQMFIGNNFTFSDEYHPIKDLNNMLSCNNYIIANSSFSWWGAWLCNNVNKMIIAPATWFGPTLSSTHNTKDLYPDDWIRI